MPKLDTNIVQLADRHRARAVAPIPAATLYRIHSGDIGRTPNQSVIAERAAYRRVRRRRPLDLFCCAIACFAAAYFLGQMVRAYLAGAL